MKCITSLLLLFALTGIVFSQGSEDEEVQIENNQLYLGMTFAPFAATNYKDAKQPFTYTTTMFGGPTYVHKSWAFTPYYNFGTNGVGMFVMHTFSTGKETVERIEKSRASYGGLGTYVVYEKSYATSGGISLYALYERLLGTETNVAAIGATTNLYKGYVLGFIETGTNLGPNIDPEKNIFTSIGMYFSFNRLITKW